MAVGGRYALIQYMPDRSRQEAINVALLLYEVGSGRCEVRVHLDTARLQALAGPAVDAPGVQAALNTLLVRTRMETEEAGLSPAQQVLVAQRILARTSLPFVVVPARGVRIEDVVSDAERLAHELLHPPEKPENSV